MKMESNHLVSVIIPVYNVSLFLREALNSVIFQTYDNLEIIIIDDGSTDNSGLICDEYAKKDKRIIVVHQDNNGLSNARNHGLDVMHGDIVAFLDSDDAYHPDYIRIMVNMLDHEKADMVICKSTVHDTLEKMNRTGNEPLYPQIRKGLYNRSTALKALVEGSIDHTVWNKIYKRKLWEHIRFPDGHVFEDVDTTYRIINCCNSILVIEEALVFHRKRPQSITRTYTPKNINDSCLAYSHLESFVERNIPDIFSSDHLVFCKRTQLSRLLDYYVCYPFRVKRCNKEKQLLEEIRNQIREIGRDVGIGKEGILKKLRYWMICTCPSIICFFYYIHFSIKTMMEQLCCNNV